MIERSFKRGVAPREPGPWRKGPPRFFPASISIFLKIQHDFLWVRARGRPPGPSDARCRRSWGRPFRTRIGARWHETTWFRHQGYSDPDQKSRTGEAAALADRGRGGTAFHRKGVSQDHHPGDRQGGRFFHRFALRIRGLQGGRALPGLRRHPRRGGAGRGRSLEAGHQGARGPGRGDPGIFSGLPPDVRPHPAHLSGNPVAAAPVAKKGAGERNQHYRHFHQGADPAGGVGQFPPDGRPIHRADGPQYFGAGPYVDVPALVSGPPLQHRRLYRTPYRFCSGDILRQHRRRTVGFRTDRPTATPRESFVRGDPPKPRNSEGKERAS